MSYLGTTLALAFANQGGLSDEARTRALVTGWAFDRTKVSPMFSAIAVKHLVDKEAQAAPVITTPSPTPGPAPTPSPGGTPARGIMSEDYAGRPFEEVETILKDAGIGVRRIDVEAPDVAKGSIATASLVVRQAGLGEVLVPLPAGMLLIAGHVVALAVNVAEQMVQVPNVEGLNIAKAKEAITAAGFTVTEQVENEGNWSDAVRKSLANLVVDQVPEGKQVAPKGSAVALIVLNPVAQTDTPTTDSAPTSVPEARSFADIPGVVTTDATVKKEPKPSPRQNLSV